MGAPLALSASTHHLFALTLPLLKCVRAILSRVHAPYSPSSFLVFVLLITHILLVVHPTTASYYQKRAENTTGRFAGAFPSEISAGGRVWRTSFTIFIGWRAILSYPVFIDYSYSTSLLSLTAVYLFSILENG